MKNRNCLTEPSGSFGPVPRRKVTVIGSPDSLLNIRGLRWVQTAQPGSAIAAGLRFRCLRQSKELNTPSEQIVDYVLRHAMIFQINETKILKSGSQAHSCSLTQRHVTALQTSEID